MSGFQDGNLTRQREASARDVQMAHRILADPQLYAPLTNKQRRVLMRRVEMPGASWAEVAAALEMSRTSAYACWHRITDGLPAEVPPETTSGNLWDQMQ